MSTFHRPRRSDTILVHLALAFVLLMSSASGASTILGVVGSVDPTGEPFTPQETLNPAGLHGLSPATGAPSAEIAQFSNGGGHSLGFNPDDGRVYFAAGFRPSHFQSTDPRSAAPTITDIPISGHVPAAGFFHDMAYEGNGSFLVIDEALDMLTISTLGVITDTGLDLEADAWPNGLAYLDGSLYTLRHFRTTLDTIDRATGALTTGPVLSLAGESIMFGIDLAADPTSGVLYGLLRLNGQDGRELVTIDPETGVATSIGDTGQGLNDRFSSLAVVPEPRAGLLLCLSLLLYAATRGHSTRPDTSEPQELSPRAQQEP